jgi:hypothetical protein
MAECDRAGLSENAERFQWTADRIQDERSKRNAQYRA